MRLTLALLYIVSFEALASTHAAAPRTLVHGFLATGPVEVAGTLPANRVVRTIQRYAAPAWSDMLASHTAEVLRDASDPPVNVLRKPRQAGFEAARAVAKAAPDGATVLLATRLPDAGLARDLQPIGVIATMPYVLVAASEAAGGPSRLLIGPGQHDGAKTLIATTGAQTIGHVALDSLRRTNPDLRPVAYNGAHAALQAVVGSHVAAAFVPLPAVMPYARGGRLRFLALAAAQRHGGLPDVPTTAEAGVRELQAVGWFGVFAPARLPASVAGELRRLLQQGAPLEGPRETFSELGLRVEYGGSDALSALLVRDGVL